jgi:hypothetical protein
MNPQNLPLGINTLDKLRGSHCIYVDKTRFAFELTKQPGAFFLSRPRRFGKSLFLDTLKEIFEGNQKLFAGLYIHDRWDWSRTFPVIKIDFAGGVLKSREELDKKIHGALLKTAQSLGLSCELEDIQGRFGEIIAGARQRFEQRVVVLVDEYDKPILDNVENLPIAAEMREGLKNLYSVLKEQDANLHFVFMTGVTKFSKVSLFSGVNQLKDITVSPAYSSLCGYTETDLKQSFGSYFEGVDFDEVRRWYNGYNWTGAETVYNPYDILLFLSEGKRFRNYWFETGSTSFLLTLFKKERYFLPNLEGIEASEEILDSFDIEQINPITLLFQTGYLTIKDTFTDINQMVFSLGIPNLEVKVALNNQFINGYAGLVNEKLGLQRLLHTQLRSADIEGLIGLIKRLFAAIPWRNFTHNDLADFEGYYASVLYAFFSSLDTCVIPEDITNHGQADMTVILGANIYVMEIKVVDEAQIEDNPALNQIIQRDYAEKYRGKPGTTVYEIGLVFSRTKRNLIRADWQ